MNRKATSVAALVAAAAVAVAPITGAVATTSGPTASSPTAVTPADVIKSVGAAPTSLASAIQSGYVGSFVVVTDEAVSVAPAALKAAPAAFASAPAGVQAAAGDAAPIALPGVPQSVTDILNVAGLPVANVFQVVQISQGVYSVWYKMLSSVPQALIKGDFGAVPTLFQKAISDSLTWITTGAGPVVPKPPAAVAAAADVPAAPSSVISDALDVAGIPVAAAYAAGQVAQSVYKNFYGLLTSVPQAILQGKFGDVPTLVLSAITKSVDAIVAYPGAQLASATAKIDKLLSHFTPPAPVTTAPETTSPDSAGTTASKASIEKTAAANKSEATSQAPKTLSLNVTDGKSSAESVVPTTGESKGPEAKTPETKVPDTKTPATKVAEPVEKTTESEKATGPASEKAVEPKAEKASEPKVEKPAESKAEKATETKAEKAESGSSSSETSGTD